MNQPADMFGAALADIATRISRQALQSDPQLLARLGSLQGNISLSKRRAQSVRQRLIDAHGVPPERMEAEGMGYLSPVASNLQEQGRDQNRRVEVILLSAE